MVDVSLLLIFFFFKQKTAYEMRISDWSSDVCSSDLTIAARAAGAHDAATGGVVPAFHLATTFERDPAYVLPGGRNYIRPDNPAGRQPEAVLAEIGRASCRERVCQYV